MSVILYDDLGQANEMVRIPKFYLSDVIEGAPNRVHPAFLIHGKEKECIYVSKYQNVVRNERACSVEGEDPAVLIPAFEMDKMCRNKGRGWHLMTNAEWAAVALWSFRNGTMPHGNNDNGKDFAHPHEHGRLVGLDAVVPEGEVGPPMRTAGGSGPASWNHDGTAEGIADMNGNVWELVSGIRWKNGIVEYVPENDAASVEFSSQEAWRELRVTTGQGKEIGICAAGGEENGNGKRTLCYAEIKETAQPDAEKHEEFLLGAFSQVQIPECVNYPGNLMQQLALAPPASTESVYFSDAAWGVTSGERYIIRGGYWVNREMAGIFSGGFYMRPEDRYFDVGFRSCYYED